MKIILWNLQSLKRLNFDKSKIPTRTFHQFIFCDGDVSFNRQSHNFEIYKKPLSKSSLNNLFKIQSFIHELMAVEQ